MLRRFVLTTAIAIAALLLNVAPVSAAPPECNWGELTKRAVFDPDFDQGEHSRDPSGDGFGKEGKEDRVGLPNLFGQGDLQATCEFIDANFPAES